MTIPREALACVDARIRALRPGECKKLLVELNAVRHKDGTLRTVALVREPRDEGERFTLVLREPA